jgi:hypothetical protein
MRVSEDRYSRDLRRIQLAQRLIRHETRTQSICAWTGLTDERVRNLCRSYEATRHGAPRHRGPSPKALSTFLRSPTLRTEASAIGGLACVLGVIPADPVRNARRTLPSITAGERLCHAFELYHQIVPNARFTMDQFILLVIGLAEREEVELRQCSNCRGALLIDRLGKSRVLCQWCEQVGARHTESPSGLQADDAQSTAEHETPGDMAGGIQQRLF